MADPDPDRDLDLEPGEDEAARATDEGSKPGTVGVGDPVEQATADQHGRADT